jgi:NADH-quinone oxidoreductase subunit G
LGQISGTAARGQEAAALMTTKNPLITAGGDAALLAAAGTLVLALRRAGVAAQLSLLLPEANSIGLGLLDGRSLADVLPVCAGRPVISLERDLTRAPDLGAAIFAEAASVAVLDHIETQTVRNADLAIATASFAGSDGIFVNLEGRVQVFFKAVFGDADPQASWLVLRDAGIAAGLLGADEWQNHAALLASLAASVPELAPCAQAWPAQAAAKLGTLPHRHSGRTAASAHIDVREPMPPRHEDSPFGTTLESLAMPVSPGWNSVQAVQRQPIPATDNQDIFLFTDLAIDHFDISAGSQPDDRILGTEELSNLSPALIARREANGI